jgi:hypothetical protein
LTSRYLICCRTGNDQETVCRAPSVILTSYSTLMLRGMLFSPTVMQKGIEPKNRSPEVSGRMLLMGLGGAEFNSYLVARFPGLAIDHVEIYPSVVEVAMQFFDFERFVCGIYQLSKDSSEENSAVRYSLSEVTRNFLQKTKTSCFSNSNVILADAFDYVDYLTSLITPQQQVKSAQKVLLPIPHQLLQLQGLENSLSSPPVDFYYDYITVDVYDSQAFLWDGEAFSGASLRRDKLNHSFFQTLRTILRPINGIAILHLHKDGYYKELVRQIIQIFHKSQLIFLDLSENDSVLVAARDRYINPEQADNRYRIPHPCTFAQSEDFDFLSTNSDLHVLAESIGIAKENIFLYDYSLNCGIINEYLSSTEVP